MASGITDEAILEALIAYAAARQRVLELGKLAVRISGNDNIIGRIGEFIALRFLESLEQRPAKAAGNANPGYDLIDEAGLRTQVKVITFENAKGRSVRLRDPWDQLVVIDLQKGYHPVRIGLLKRERFDEALVKQHLTSTTPFVSRTMLGPKGLIGRYGTVYKEKDLTKFRLEVSPATA